MPEAATINRLLPSENGHAPTARKTLKVAIVGKAPSSQQLAPYGDPSWEIWSLSDAPKEIPRWDRHFELHDIEGAAAGDGRVRREKWGPYWEFLKRDHGSKPIYLQHPHPDIPKGIIFPKQDVLQHFPPYFTNTVSWLIAYALHIGTGDSAEFDLKELGLYGVDMAQHGTGLKSEYAHQRPSCEFFLGICAGKGISIHVPESSDLLKARRLYAFDSDGGAFAKKCLARRKELTDQQQKLAQENQQLKQKLEANVLRQHVLAGALDDQDWVHEWH